MKKYIVVILTLLLPLCQVFGMARCKSDPPFPKLDDDTAWEIITAFYDEHSDVYESVDEVNIHLYYGCYNGAYVADISCEKVIEYKMIQIETCSLPSTILAYKGGEFFSMSDAYDAELLTNENLKTIERFYRRTLEY